MNKKKKFLIVLIPIIILVLCIIIYFINNKDNKIEYKKYSEFSNELESLKVKKVEIEKDNLKYLLDDGSIYITDNPKVNDFREKLLLKNVEVIEDNSEENLVFFFDLVFYLIFFGAAGFGIYKLFSFSSKTFKVVKHTNVKFDDIAGMDEIKVEMLKHVEVLKNPKEYQNKGIRQIKGIILEGPPGNGKTLFAKALAEEANVNFIATKGADFQSAMMSMGARKIKMLFRKATRYRPCIIFIDEFDGIGERRNYAGTGVDKENNRIITAMLNEMDGFDTKDGILVIAATNSYVSLDPALIRPGRFDIKYSITNPDYNTRLKLVELYTSKKVLSEELDKKKMADAFNNLSSSAIEAILNEASMIAILQKNEKITVENIIVAARKTNCNININKLTK